MGISIGDHTLRFYRISKLNSETHCSKVQCCRPRPNCKVRSDGGEIYAVTAVNALVPLYTSGTWATIVGPVVSTTLRGSA